MGTLKVDLSQFFNLIKVALVLKLVLELGFNLVNRIKPRGNPNTNINMNSIPIQNPLLTILSNLTLYWYWYWYSYWYWP